jgi:hypothetical protein
MTCTQCAGKADQPIDAGEPHPQPHDCTVALNQLVDVAVRSGQAFTTAVLQCCAAPRGCGCESAEPTGSAEAESSKAAAVNRVVHSGQLSARPNAKDRRVTLETPLANGYLAIPPERITLQPSGGRDPQLKPLGALKPNQTTFQVDVEAGGIPGAVYFGTVRVSALDGSPDELIPVFVEL